MAEKTQSILSFIIALIGLGYTLAAMIYFIKIRNGNCPEVSYDSSNSMMIVTIILFLIFLAYVIYRIVRFFQKRTITGIATTILTQP